jgi:hypothetical protein
LYRPRAIRAVPLGLLLGRLALMKVAGAVVGVALGLAITWVAGRLGDAGARARARRARARPADLPLDTTGGRLAGYAWAPATSPSRR